MYAFSPSRLRLALCAVALLGALAGGVEPAAAEGAKRIINFWRVDCPPCIHELAILPTIAERNPELAITLLALKDDGRAAEAIEQDSHPNLMFEAFDGDAAALLANYGNAKQALPLSVALAADGTVCARHFGLLGTEIASQWAAQC